MQGVLAVYSERPRAWREEEVEALAAQELRSANAQVEYLLREALLRRGRKVGAEAVEREAGKTQK